MEITALAAEKDRDKAIRYVYKQVAPSKTPFFLFKHIVLKSPPDNLPEFYILKDNGNYIGYLLLLADSMKEVPNPFSYLACHNGDELSYEDHCSLLRFAIQRAVDGKYAKLDWLFQNELANIQEGNRL